jgi:hypothetical protein
MIYTVKDRRLVFALFSLAILFSMVREWNAPVSCPRANVFLPASFARSR